MDLNNQTAEKLAEALNNFSESMDRFLREYPKGISLDTETYDLISSFNSNLKKFNLKNV